MQPQVAFNTGPKPLGNREVVTSIQVIFHFEETLQWHSYPLWKGGKAESKWQSKSTNIWSGGDINNRTKQNNAAVLFSQTTPRDLVLLQEGVSSTWWCCWNYETGATLILERNPRGFSSCFWQRPTPDAPHNQLMGELLRKQRAKTRKKSLVASHSVCTGRHLLDLFPPLG